MGKTEEILTFLKENKPFYLATVDGNQARLRPIGTSNLFEGKIYFQTGREKDMYAQLKKSPHVEIVAFDGNQWLRITAYAIEDERVEAAEALLENYPRLRERYAPGDGNTTVFYLDIESAYYDSNAAESKTILIPAE